MNKDSDQVRIEGKAENHQTVILCDECRFTREPHEHRCYGGDCQCPRCHPEEFFNPDRAERTAYEFTCKFSYSGFLQNEFSSDKHTLELAELLRQFSTHERSLMEKEKQEVRNKAIDDVIGVLNGAYPPVDENVIYNVQSLKIK